MYGANPGIFESHFIGKYNCSWPLVIFNTIISISVTRAAQNI